MSGNSPTPRVHVSLHSLRCNQTFTYPSLNISEKYNSRVAELLHAKATPTVNDSYLCQYYLWTPSMLRSSL